MVRVRLYRRRSYYVYDKTRLSRTLDGGRFRNKEGRRNKGAPRKGNEQVGILHVVR